jgi:hypothetical protein
MMDLRKPEDLRQLRPRLQGMVLIVAHRLHRPAQAASASCRSSRASTTPAGPSATSSTTTRSRPRAAASSTRGAAQVASNRPAYTLFVTPRPRDHRRDRRPQEGPDRRPQSPQRRPDRRGRRPHRLRRRRRPRGVHHGKIHAATATRSPATTPCPCAQPQLVRVRQDPDPQALALGDWVEIRESARRFYPAGELTAFITGYVGEITPDGLAKSPGYRPGERIGKTGIERQWENYLRGRPGKRSRVVDVRRRVVKDPPAEAARRAPPDEDPIPGQDIYLTLDLDLQQVAAEAFADKPAGALVAMDPRTGKILAMLSVPAIDPNRWQQPIGRDQYASWSQSPLKPFIDRTVQEHYFPGSTYKVVSALAALDDPTFDPEEEITCDGFIKYGGRKFKCTHKHGPVNLEQAIVQSCNVYFYTLAVEKNLGLEAMEKFARRLGLGERTGLGINSEAKGRIPTEAFEAREGTYQRGVRSTARSARATSPRPSCRSPCSTPRSPTAATS